MRRRGILALAAFALLAGCTPDAARTPAPADASALVAARNGLRSRVWVEGAGTVARLLRDDTKRPRHQRFVLRVDGAADFTVMIAHNIDLAPRVPLKPGDHITFRGEYVWNEQGGVVHRTHRDPRGGPGAGPGAEKGGGGWIRWRDFVYR